MSLIPSKVIITLPHALSDMFPDLLSCMCVHSYVRRYVYVYVCTFRYVCVCVYIIMYVGM